MPDVAAETQLAGTMVVISPLGKENVLGRALALAELADTVVERVVVAAPDDGPLWAAAGRWPFPVTRADSAAAIASALDLEDLRWVWVVKPLRRSWSMGRDLAEAHPGAGLILDIDDDDEELSREFVNASLGNRVRVNRLRQLHPARVRATRREALRRADGVTVASHAVARQSGVGEVGDLRVPHPRSIARAERRRPPYAGGEKHVGFFGTVRSHKGVSSIGRLLEADPSVVLHIFAGSDRGSLGAFSGQIVEHPGDEPWESLFDSVDLTMLPQHRSRGGDVQLPAKLLDAMRFGVPVVASPTRAIREIAGETVLYVDDWADVGQVREALETCLARGDSLGAAARGRFENELSLEANAPGFRDFLETVGRAGSPG